MLTVAALYKFTRIDDPDALRSRLLPVAAQGGVRGTLILAREGLNGTIAGSDAAIADLLAAIRREPGLAEVEAKISLSPGAPFRRLKLRVKREIVTMGIASADPGECVGRYVDAGEWNAFLSRDDVVLVDTRNRYEVAAGTFRGAVDPDIGTFREFPSWWDANKAAFAGKKVAMFCTGGIRCEKATNYAATRGEADVYHLKGGILAYLERVPRDQSHWQGNCFVFDERESLGHGLVPASSGQSHVTSDRGEAREVSAKRGETAGADD